MALERMLKRSPQDEVHIELCTPTFKLLAPKTLASAIQFSHLVIENAAQGKLHLTEPEDLYPGTEQQVVTIESPAWENIASAMKHILAMANNCTECVMPGHEDERRLAIVMPSRSISALIGVKGANVKELQLRTGCHIHVDDVAIGHGPGGDRAVNINGLPAGLEQAIVRTVEVVQESHDQVWFRKWAERSNAERLEQEQAPPLRGQVLRNSEEGNGCMGSMMGNMAGMMMGNMTGANLVIQAMEEMPAFVSEDPRGFILRSAVPTRMAEALQHKAMQVTGSTNTKISFSGDPTSNARVMSVQGALFNICAGFMLMMRHYLEIERELCQ